MKHWDELELRHLKYALCVAEQKGFTQAAFYLGIDQGFLSRQIHWLEKRLGFDLFERKKRPVGLTDAGRDFLEEARRILAQTERAVELAQQTQDGKRGRVDVGINTSIANSTLPDILRAFHRQFSTVNLVLHELASYDQIEKLLHQQLDVGFFHRHNLQNLGSHPHEGLISLPILQEPLVVVIPENHRLAGQDSISLTALSQEQFVLPPRSKLYGLREQIERLCLDASFQPIVRQEAAWITTVLSLVAGGVGVSLLPANVKSLQRQGVVYHNIQEHSPVLEIIAVWRADNASTTLKNFLNVVKSFA